MFGCLEIPPSWDMEDFRQYRLTVYATIHGHPGFSPSTLMRNLNPYPHMFVSVKLQVRLTSIHLRTGTCTNCTQPAFSKERS